MKPPVPNLLQTKSVHKTVSLLYFQVLDVGSGSGYLTAVMSYMVRSNGDKAQNSQGGKAVGIEHIPELKQASEEAAHHIPFAHDMIEDGSLQFITVGFQSFFLADFQVGVCLILLLQFFPSLCSASLFVSHFAWTLHPPKEAYMESWQKSQEGVLPFSVMTTESTSWCNHFSIDFAGSSKVETCTSCWYWFC